MLKKYCTEICKGFPRVANFLFPKIGLMEVSIIPKETPGGRCEEYAVILQEGFRWKYIYWEVIKSGYYYE